MFIVHDLSLETKRLLYHFVMLGVLFMWYGNLGDQIEGYRSGLKILQNTVMSRIVCLRLLYLL